MFNLIITIISIALVVAMAAAAVYYGGTAFTQGTAKANAATLVTQAQQINGAVTLFKNDNGGTAPGSVAALVPTYLQNAPVPGSAGSTTAFWALDVNGDSIVESKGGEVCDQLNVSGGHDGTSVLSAAVYGCNEADNVLTYKN